MLPKPKDIDPTIQAIFDAMFNLMQAKGVPTCNAWANQTGNGMGYGVSITGFDGAQVSYSYFTPGSRVVITPPNATVGPGATMQFSATATDANGGDLPGATFTWRMAAGSPGMVDATGLYTAPATITTQTSAMLTAALSDNSAWATASIALMP
jgi:Bacterial Ig-like domain (group 2)